MPTPLVRSTAATLRPLGWPAASSRKTWRSSRTTRKRHATQRPKPDAMNVPADANVLFDIKRQSSALSSDIATALPGSDKKVRDFPRVEGTPEESARPVMVDRSAERLRIPGRLRSSSPNLPHEPRKKSSVRSIFPSRVVPRRRCSNQSRIGRNLDPTQFGTAGAEIAKI